MTCKEGGGGWELGRVVEAPKLKTAGEATGYPTLNPVPGSPELKGQNRIWMGRILPMKELNVLEGPFGVGLSA